MIKNDLTEAEKNGLSSFHCQLKLLSEYRAGNSVFIEEQLEEAKNNPIYGVESIENIEVYIPLIKELVYDRAAEILSYFYKHVKKNSLTKENKIEVSSIPRPLTFLETSQVHIDYHKSYSKKKRVKFFQESEKEADEISERSRPHRKRKSEDIAKSVVPDETTMNKNTKIAKVKK